MSAEPGIAHQGPNATQEASQKSPNNPEIALPINHSTLLDYAQSSQGTSPPPSEQLENNGSEEDRKSKGDLTIILEQAEATLACADQLEKEMEELLGDSGGGSNEEASDSSQSPYNEAEDSVVIATHQEVVLPGRVSRELGRTREN
jgi:hypothetical protein